MFHRVIFMSSAFISSIMLISGCSTHNVNKSQSQINADFLKKHNKAIKTKNKKTDNIDNACLILKQNPDWHRALYRTQLVYRISIPVQLAFVRHESSFNHKARPVNNKKKWFIFNSYKSTAYGFAQVLNGTWDEFQTTFKNKKLKRTNFGHSVEFIGWYNRKHINSGLDGNNISHLYLAYHEGLGGYKKKTYINKPCLVDYSNSVQKTSIKYSNQISSCNIKVKK